MAKSKPKTRKIKGIVLAYNTSKTKDNKKRYGIQIWERDNDNTYWINGFGDLPPFIEEGVTIEATITDDEWHNIKAIEKAPETPTDSISPKHDQSQGIPEMEAPASLKPTKATEIKVDVDTAKLDCATTIAIAMKGQLIDKTDIKTFMDATKKLYDWVMEND